MCIVAVGGNVLLLYGMFKQFIRELTNRKFYDNEAALIVGS